MLEFALFASSSKSLETVYIDEQKTRISIEVEHVTDMIEFNRDQSRYRLRQVVRERTEQAWRVMEGIYRRYGDSMGKDELIRLVAEALRPLRYNGDRGYFFMTDLSGVERLFAVRPELEGTNLLGMQSPDGRYIIREMIGIAEKNGEGFITYPWTHPSKPGNGNMKTSYIKLFPRLGVFVGYGEYETDIDEDIQREVLQTIGQLSYGKDGYVFVYRHTDGVMLQNAGSPELVNTDVSEVTDDQGVRIIRELTRIALAEARGGFFQYRWKRPVAGPPVDKISYVRQVPDWNWVVGTGVYLSDLEQSMLGLSTIITLALQVRVALIVLLLVLTLLMVLALSRLVSKKISGALGLIGDFLGRAFRESVKIPLGEITLVEFREMASLANHSVDMQREVMERLSTNERRYRSLFEASNDAIFIHEAGGEIIEINERSKLIFPALRKSNRPGNLLDLFEGDERRRMEDYLRVLQASGIVRMEVGARNAHGDAMHLDIASNIIEPGQSWAQTLMRDITPAVLSREKIERLNLSLAKKIEAQSRDLADAQLLLLKTEQMASLGRLVSVFGHELGTPLGIGITLASMTSDQSRGIQEKLALGTLTKAEIEGFMATLVESSDLLGHNLQRASDLMANLKLIAVDQASNEAREFNFKDYLEKIIQSLEPLMRKSPHHIELECPGSLVIQAKPGLWYQIITNLVNNSIIHAFESGQTGTIRIVVEGDKAAYTLVYQDNGRGIPPDLQDRVFDEFFTTRRGQGGSGLGLSIVKNLADELGAELNLVSEPGQGVCFTFRIPSKP